MGESRQKSPSEPSLSAEDVSKKLDYIIRRLDALEQLIAKNPEYEEYAAPLRLTKMGLGLYEEPLRIASEMKLAEQTGSKLETAHAEIQASLILRATEVKVGEDVRISIEITNPSTSPAKLERIENLIPEGFRLIKVPRAYRLEDSSLNMKEKLLGARGSVEVKIALKASTKGTFNLKPRVVYSDGKGSRQSCEPKPITIKVRELGISGWLRGPE